VVLKENAPGVIGKRVTSFVKKDVMCIGTQCLGGNNIWVLCLCVVAEREKFTVVRDGFWWGGPARR
jgi:hypothetical protein